MSAWAEVVPWAIASLTAGILAGYAAPDLRRPRRRATPATVIDSITAGPETLTYAAEAILTEQLSSEATDEVAAAAEPEADPVESVDPVVARAMERARRRSQANQRGGKRKRGHGRR